MKKVSGLVFLGLAIAFISCASNPKTENKPVEEAPVEEVVTETETQPADNASALENTENARASALACGADKAAPVQFKACDALFEALKAKAQNGTDISKELLDLQNRYEALSLYTKAKQDKQKIDDNNFASNNQEKYDAGCASLSELENIFSSSNIIGSDMKAKAQEASGCFAQVLFDSYKKLAKEERINAFNAKKDADSVKAAVASKENYNKAVEDFRAGDSSYAMQNPESAFNHYKSSKELFAVIYGDVKAKRDAAQKAIDEAKQKVLESQNYAHEADAKAPLKEEDVKGIEAEDAKLLEDDQYEDPEAQKAVLPEDVESVVTGEDK